MASSFTWTLQYRLLATNTWLTQSQAQNLDKDPETGNFQAEITGLTRGSTYEFRWLRISKATGQIAAYSNAITATIPAAATSVTAANGGTATLGSTGSFNVTFGTGGNAEAVGVTRTAQKLILQLSANWDYVRLHNISPALAGSEYYVKKTGTFNPPQNYPLDPTKITKLSNKIVEILLTTNYTYKVSIEFAGNSSGIIQVNAVV